MQSGATLSRSTRNRAVRLTSDGYKRLQVALLARCADHGEGSRPTRELQASVMGVSVATSRRILSRAGVDRNTLLFVFQNLGIPWQDCFCAPVSDSLSVPRNETVVHPRQVGGPAPRPYIGVAVGTIVVTVILLAAAVQILALGHPSAAAPQSDPLTAVLLEGMKHYRRGEYADADVDFRRATAMAEATDSNEGRATARRMFGDLASVRGDYATAKNCYATALALRRHMTDYRSEPAILEALGCAETELGELNLAKDHLTSCLSEYERFADAAGAAMAYRDLGTVDHLMGDIGGARKRFDQAEAALAEDPDPDMKTDIRARRALLLRDEKRVDEARRELESCLAYWKARTHPRWIAVTLYQLGTVEAAAGNPAAAKSMLTESRSRFASVGDMGGVAKCNASLRLPLGR